MCCSIEIQIMLTRDGMSLCDKLTHNQHLKGLHILDIESLFCKQTKDCTTTQIERLFQI